MTAKRLALVGAGIAVGAWALKAVAIWVAGGLDLSPFEGPLFVLGFVALLVAFAGFGLAATSKRTQLLKVVGAVIGVVIGVALFLVIEDAVGTLVPESAGWVQEEAGLWASSILTLLIALALSRGDKTTA